MGDITHILTAFQSEVWAILPNKLADIRGLLYSRAQGQRVSEEDIERIQKQRTSREAALLASVQAVDVNAARRGDGVIMSATGRVAIVPVFGVLAQRVGTMERASGGISTEELGGTLDSLASDKQVRQIAMIYDSPGGSVSGLQVLAEKMRTIRDSKKIVGVVDPMAASAAFWLISQSSEVVATPGSQIGSHGVVSAHEDYSAMQQAMGVKVTLIASSQEKIAANPYEPLTAEGRADIEKKVRYYMGEFTSDLAKGRGVTENKVAKQFGNGLMFTPEEAKERGMVDRVEPFANTLRRMSAGIMAEDHTPPIVAEAPKTLPRGAVAARVRAIELSGR